MGHRGITGLQNHSIGLLYPLTVRGVGDTLQAYNCLTGQEGPKHPYNFNIKSGPGSFGAAHDAAELDCVNLREAA